MAEAETEPETCTMAVFIIREDEDPLKPAGDIGIVIEGVKVLNDAFAMLFGTIYALNLSYPSDLRYTFEALQKVYSLSGKL